MKTGQIVKHHIRTMIEYREMHEPNEFARRHDPRLLKRVYGINYPYCKEIAKISHAEQPRFLRGLNRWFCQTDTNQSQFSCNDDLLGCKKAAPLCESGGAVGLEILSAVKGAFFVEMVVDQGVDRSKLLR